jgi:hypothetical protein
MDNLPRKLNRVSYYQGLAQKKCPAAIKLLSDATNFLHGIMRNEEVLEDGTPKYCIGDRIKAASALVKASDTIIKAAGVYQPHAEDSLTTAQTMPLIQIMLSQPQEARKVIELNPQTNGTHK